LNLEERADPVEDGVEYGVEDALGDTLTGDALTGDTLGEDTLGEDALGIGCPAIEISILGGDFFSIFLFFSISHSAT